MVGSELIGRLFELGFLKGAGEIFEELKQPVKDKEENLLSLARSGGVEPAFAQKVIECGENSFRAYIKHLKCSLYHRLGEVKPVSVDEVVVNRILYSEVGEPLNFANADFISYFETEKGEKLTAILEITTIGATESLRKLYHGQVDDALVGKGRGIRPSVNYLQKDLIEFAGELSSFLSGVDPVAVLREEVEAVKFAQVLGNALSHALTELATPYYFIGIVSPLFEFPNGLFTFDLKRKEEAREVLKSLEFLREVDEERIAESLKRLRSYYRRKKALGVVFLPPEDELKEALEEEVFEEEVGRIEEVREDVKRLVEKSNNGEINFYLHPAGAGKTTQIINLALSEAEKKAVLFIYFAPRKKVIEDKREEVEEKAKGKGLSIISFGVKRRYSARRSYGGRGEIDKQVGNLKSILGKFYSYYLPESDRLADITAIFSTTQSLSRTSFGKTSVHIKNMVSLFVEKAKKEGKEPLVICTIDEITGSEGGIPALKDLAEDLKSFSSITRIFVLDANLLCGKVLEEYIGWADSFLSQSSHAPEFLSRIKEEEYSSSLEGKLGKLWGWEACSYSKPGFPAKKLVIKGVTLPLKKGGSSEERNRERIESFLKLLLSVGEKTFFYLQNKTLVEKLGLELEKKGKTVALIDSRKVIGDVRKADYILSTSSASRGIDIPVDRAVVVIPSFSPEVQLGELYQAVSRIRRGKEDSESVKEIILVYSGSLESEVDKYKAARLIKLVKRLVLSYALKEGVLKERVALLPPIREHRGDESLSLDNLKEIEDWTGVKVFSTALLYGSIPKRKPDVICYPFAYYYNVKFPLEPILPLLKEAKSRLLLMLKDKGSGIREGRVKELLDFLELADFPNGLKIKVSIAIHLPIGQTFRKEISGQKYDGKRINYLVGERVGEKCIAFSDGYLIFLLKQKRTNCYGAVPRIPIEILSWI